MKRSERIEALAREYIAVVSHTGTSAEKNIEGFFKKYFSEVEYFKDNPDKCGFYPVKDDYLDRTIPWALLKGEGNRTVVLIHHTDTVDTDDFGIYKDEAYDPERVLEILKNGDLPIGEEVQRDID